MKKLTVIVILILLYGQVSSQFPFHTILPVGVSGTAYGDTMLNTRTVLLREGIKKITAVQTSSLDEWSFSTTYTVTDGRIRSRAWCRRRSPDSAFRFCLLDTLLYNNKGGLQEYWSGGNRETAFIRVTINDSSDGKRVETWSMKDSRKPKPETLVYAYYRIYHGQDQTTSQQFQKEPANAVNLSLYYHADGLIDSIRHENPAWGTYVFNRKQKGKNTLLTLTFPRSIYNWVYNQSGQCISSAWQSQTIIKMPDGYREKLKSKAAYFYNNDGTLSKVIEKNNGYSVTTIYNYER